MAISPEAQRILDAYATSVCGPQVPCDKQQIAPFFFRTFTLLVSLAVLVACTATPAPNPPATFAKESTVNTVSNHRPVKTYMDDSEPFTLPELEERLLKVLALPPAQITPESINESFGITLVREANELESGFFMEDISEDKRVFFLISLPRPLPGNTLFSYQTYIRKTKDGQQMLEGSPREIPEAYKFAYLPFVQKLEKLGWKAEGVHRNVGYYWNYFVKDDFLMKLYIDDYLGMASEEPDYSRTGISRIVIDAPNKR